MLGRKLPHVPSEAMAGIQNYFERRSGVLQHVLRPGEKLRNFGTSLPWVNVAHTGLTTLAIH